MVGDKKTFSLYFSQPGYNTTPEYALSLMGCSHICINPLKVSLDCRVQELDLLPQPLGLLVQLGSLLLHLTDVLGSLLQRGGFANLCQRTGASLHVSSAPESFTHIQFYSIMDVKRLLWLNVIRFCSSTVQKRLFGDARCPRLSAHVSVKQLHIFTLYLYAWLGAQCCHKIM